MLNPAPTRRMLGCVLALALGLAPACTATPPKKPNPVVTSICEDEPLGDDENGDPCPCKADPKLEGCPDPCADDACVADAGGSGDAAAEVVDVKSDVKPDVIKDSEVEQQLDFDVDAMRYLPETAKQLDDGGIQLGDGLVVDPKEVLQANDVYVAKDVAADVDGGEGSNLDDAEVGSVTDTAVEEAETGGSDIPDIDNEVASGSDSSADAEIDTTPEDTGPPPKCAVDKDCVGPPKPCKDYRCMLAPNGQAGCYYINTDDGGACDDGKACTVLDHCSKGACVGTTKFCPDADDTVCTQSKCTEPGGCTFAFLPEGTPCNDFNPCTDSDTCLGGKCKAGEKTKCQCFTNADCAGWEDANLCNGTLVCKLQACVIDAKTVVLFQSGLTCDPSKDNACQAAQCVPQTGKCQLFNLPNGTGCSDNDACTTGDLCIDGKCKGKDKSDTCDDKNPCTDDNCDTAVGCKYVPNANLCDDGDTCTDLDQCGLGVCKGATKKVCECKTGADCVKYEDGNLCNGSMKCVNFACVLDPNTIVTCPPGSPCAPQQCTKSNGKCDAVLLKNGEVCSDSNVCTVGDTCDGQGFCKPGLTVNCSDKNGCTKDDCVPAVGCVFSFANGVPCNDGDGCTSPDSCQDGACKPGTYLCECTADIDCITKVAAFDKCKGAWTCDPEYNLCKYDQKFISPCKDDPTNPCTVTECIPDTGKCADTLQPDNSTCNDGQFCTLLDHCKNGKCIGAPNPCDDKLPCTADKCDPKLGVAGCVSDPVVLDGITCEDGSACSTGDTCQAGSCVGKSVACDDKNPCTNDVCDKKQGCVYAPMAKGAPCSDGNACTGDPGNTGANFAQDGCSGLGQCTGGDTKICASDQGCVEIPCNSTATELPGIKLGCENKTYLTGKPCNDGDSCTLGEKCSIGLCAEGTPTQCDDNNACTNDGCDKLKGCVHAPVANACDDGDACTFGDVCTDGACKGKPKTCDDENICTNDACDPKKNPQTGCVHTKGVGDCGEFAKCTVGDVPKCAFTGGAHLVISEIYVGKPNDPSDDWIELYNPTNNSAKMVDYVLEVRAIDAIPEDPWATIAAGKAGSVLAPHTYFLFGAGAIAQGGVAVDGQSAKFNLELPLAQPTLKAACFVDSKRHLSVRLRDVPHTLVHDRVSWNDGQAVKIAAGVTPVDADPEQWPTFTSIERKATQSSDNSSMYPHKPEWLAGNTFDSDDDQADFFVRYWPEPQNFANGQYEPACGGTCSGGKRCNFSLSSEKCLDDVECKSFGTTSAAACGVGKVCQNGAQSCQPDPTGTVTVSEIHMGSDGEAYIELYNSGSKAVPIAGWKIQRKNTDDQPFKPWIVTLATVPAGVSLPPKRYYLIGTQAWGRVHGQIDQVLQVPPGFDPAGGALRLWDPSSDTELDLVGWGIALTYSNAGLDGKHKPALSPELGQSLERKAGLASTAKTMATGGGDDLLGNGQDSANDVVDFIVTDPSPQTFASGVYEPACSGTCKNGLVCNYVGGSGDQCVDIFCATPCEIGRGCNPKTGQCSFGLVIGEFATDGLGATDQFGAKMFPSNNEYVVLYNPSPSTITLNTVKTVNGVPVKDALALQWQALSDTTFSKLTDTDVTKTTLSGTVAPYSYYLVVPPSYDATLPTPDFVSNKDWGIDTAGGVVRLVRANGNYADGGFILDKVAWGTAASKGESVTAVAAQVHAACNNSGQSGALRRKALSVAEAAQTGDPFAGPFYQGAGLDTNVTKDDWTRIALRTPRSQKCGQPYNPDGTPFCVGYALAQKP